jgi:outer membrane biosynthesis protein TonB
MTSNKDQRFSANYKYIGWVVSLLVHILIVLYILYVPGFVREKPAAAYEGVVVSFGLPIESEGEEPGKTMPDQEIEPEETEPEDFIDKVIEEEIKTSIVEEESPVVVEKQESPIPAKKEKTEVKVIKEENPAEKMDKAKDEFGKLFSKKGTNAQNGQNQGDPLGEPDAEAISGISKGKGKVGGGLDSRGVLFEPEIVEQSQKSGKVVVRVCVDKDGKVISSKFTQKGSTTTDRELVEIAEISAMRYRFVPGELVEQCGTISINFIVR